MSFDFNSVIDHAILHVGPQEPAVFNTLLKEVVYEFLRDSQAYTIDVTLPSVLDQLVYDFATQAQGFWFYKICSIKYNDGPAISSLDWAFTRQNTITFTNAFRAAGNDVTVNAILVSKDESIISKLPDNIYDMYARQISFGVLAKMARIPNKPYTSIPASNDYFREYTLGLRDAQFEVNQNRNFRGQNGSNSTTKS